MKMKVLIMAIAALTIAASFTLHVKTLKVNVKDSQIGWVGKAVTGKHNGTINIKSGTLDVENGLIKGGKFLIDMKTINVVDLEGADKKRLTSHLNSNDFFNVAQFPNAEFKITSVKKSKVSDATYNIIGELTLKGIKNTIAFPANIIVQGEKVNAKATFVIDRTQWNIKYSSGSFFDSLGDRMIYDDMELTLNLSSL